MEIAIYNVIVYFMLQPLTYITVAVFLGSQKMQHHPDLGMMGVIGKRI